MPKVRYGIATYDRWSGAIDSGLSASMDGCRGGFYEFFESAGENGWELCGSFPSGTVGDNVAQADGNRRKTIDPSDYITFIFKKV
ncbi:MAG: hypothetical protein WB439_02090 [Acidobacteriaceae bacterium]